MNFNGLIRRNRFKNRPTAAKAPWQWPKPIIEWRKYGKRAGLVAITLAVLGAFLLALDRPVRTVSMDGSFQRVSPGQIEKAVAPYAHAGFLSTDLDAVEDAVEALPWVDHARVQRRWPNSLHVTVVEQTAAARWGDSGLLNTRGQLFVRAATHVPAELPRLSGPDGTESQVAQRYLSAQGRVLEAGMRIAALRLDERGEAGALAVSAPLDDELRPLPRRLRRCRAVLETIAADQPIEVHLRCLTKLDSSTRHTSSSKSMPAWRAAMGTRLWSVMPGVVLISMK